MKWYKFLQRIEKKSSTNDDKVPVIWIHGANQSSLCFNYLSEKCGFQKETFVNYSSSKSFYENLELIYGQVEHLAQCFIIGHSIGGLYALHLLEKLNVKGVVSISTPFNGSRTADWAKFVVPKYQLFKDAGRRAHPIISGHEIKINCHWTQVVSTAGSVPYHEGPNDGVCTVASMEHRKADMRIIQVGHTHFEVMVSSEVSKIVKNSYEEVQVQSRLSNGQKC